MKIAIISLLFASMFLLPARGLAQQSKYPAAGLVLQNLAIQVPVQRGEMGRMSAVFEVVRNAFQDFCGKNRNHAACKSDATEEEAINKLVQTSPQLLAFINTGSIPDLCKKGHKEFCGESNGRGQTQRIVETGSPSDSASAAEARMDKACSYGLSMTARDITNAMADCAKATNDWEDAVKAEAAVQNRAKAEAMRGTATGGEYLVSLTGTTGLPVTGTCSFAGKAESYDDVLPAQHVFTAGRGVLCSFVKKYVQGTLRMQIIQNGTVRDQAETEASYGVVSLTVDW